MEKAVFGLGDTLARQSTHTERAAFFLMSGNRNLRYADVRAVRVSGRACGLGVIEASADICLR